MTGKRQQRVAATRAKPRARARKQVTRAAPPPPQPEAFIIPLDVLAGTITYLRKRPYEEVAEGLEALATLQPYTPPAPATEA